MLFAMCPKNEETLKRPPPLADRLVSLSADTQSRKQASMSHPSPGTDSPSRFALIGAAGFIAPRHMEAIRDTGNILAAAVDPHDSVGIIDSYFPEARFFTEIERFDRHLEKLRRQGDGAGIEYVSICSPNYLHDAHVRLALRVQADAVCEKPLVVNPWNLDQLKELEEQHGKRIHTILQLRLHPELQRLKRHLSGPATGRHDVTLTYITRRGAWYPASWKGSDEKSGGIAMNIGIHMFDIVLWLFGALHESEVHLKEGNRIAGTLELEYGRVRWFFSADGNDLPESARAEGKHAYRALQLDSEEIDLSAGFTGLHTRMYEEILSGRGFGIEDARPSIEAVYDIRHADCISPRDNAHPLVSRKPM